jgi:hypothetical protein
MAEVGSIASKQPGECSAAVKLAGRSGTAFESTGTKRAAPEQSSSDRLAKRSRVHSKM